MKSFGQFCPLAQATQLLCERWTLLVVRELVAKLPDWLQASGLSQLGSKAAVPQVDWQTMEDRP
jgi:DNA-binding HxlR family transcriptional regulator